MGPGKREATGGLATVLVSGIMGRPAGTVGLVEGPAIAQVAAADGEGEGKGLGAGVGLTGRDTGGGSDDGGRIMSLLPFNNLVPAVLGVGTYCIRG